MKYYALITKTQTGVSVMAQAITEDHAEVIALTRYQELIPLESSWSVVVMARVSGEEHAERGF